MICVLLGVTCAYGFASGDALITEGYLNEVFFPKVQEYIEKAVSSISSDGSAGQKTESFAVVSVKKDEKFLGDAGCEFILRQGAATVITSELGGLNDVTSGEDLKEGAIPPNHLLIVPRDDSRGFLATKDVLIMVKGGYTIQ